MKLKENMKTSEVQSRLMAYTVDTFLLSSDRPTAAPTTDSEFSTAAAAVYVAVGELPAR
jgi:hypothetical protein